MREKVNPDQRLLIVLPPVVPHLMRKTDLRCSGCGGWVTVDADHVRWLFQAHGVAPMAMHEACHQQKYGRVQKRLTKSPNS